MWDGGLGVWGRFSGWNGGREEYSTWGNRLAWYLRGVQEGEVVIIENLFNTSYFFRLQITFKRVYLPAFTVYKLLHYPLDNVNLITIRTAIPGNSQLPSKTPK